MQRESLWPTDLVVNAMLTELLRRVRLNLSDALLDEIRKLVNFPIINF